MHRQILKVFMIALILNASASMSLRLCGVNPWPIGVLNCWLALTIIFQERLYHPIIARLLHWSNSGPPAINTDEFYDLKRRLLREFGTLDGGDIQHIVKKCWGMWDHWDDASIPCGPNCRKCGGTGIYYQTWWSLAKYKWCGFSFHTPEFQIYYDPGGVTIEGRIEHRSYGRLSSEAVLWLYLLCGEFNLFLDQLTCTRCCGWVWYPMLILQQIAFELRMTFSRKKCYRCSRWFTQWRSGWQICWKCQKNETRKFARCEDDVPF